MSLLRMDMVLPDGRSCQFHAVAEFSFDLGTSQMLITVQSFETEANARDGRFPAARHIVKTTIAGGWKPEYADKVLSFVISDPAWRGAVIQP